MAITWGATSGYFRLGIDIKVSGTRATVIVYGQSVGYGHNWTYPLNLTGSWGGSKQVSFYSGTGQTVTKELHRTTQSFTGRRSYGANISYWNGAASVSRSVTISAPPKPTPPATPGLSKISRSSDTQHVLSWSHSGGATGFSIERRDYVDGAWGAWRVVGAANSTSARSYTDAGTVAGRAYQWRMRARNSVGYSAYSGVSLVTPTTPTVVPSVTAKRAGSGVRVAWEAENSAPSNVGWQVMHDVKGGSSIQVGGNQAAGTREYVHASPDPERVQSYRVRQYVYTPHDGGKTLYGPWGASNTVQLIAKPAAPTVVWPQPEQMYGLGRIWLRWTHNATDGSEQSKAVVEVWKNGELIFQTTVNGADDRYLWTPPGLGRYVVNVRTKGSHPDWSDWSGATAFTVADYPDVTVLSPVDVVDTNTAVAAWDVSQAQGYRQNAFRLSLFDIGGVELGVWEGTGNTTVYPLPYTVENNTEYVLTVEVATNDLWSLPVEQYFRVEYEQPATPIINATWDDDTGAATVYADAGLADITTPPTKRIDLYRSVDGGVSWELVLEDFEPNTALSDYRCLTYGETLYKATAFTDIGGVAEAVFVLDVRSDKMWIGAGEGYTETIGIRYDPEVYGSAHAERAALVFDGRALPVPMLGVQRAGEMELVGRIVDGEAPSLNEFLEFVTGGHLTYLVRVPGKSLVGIVTDATYDRVPFHTWLVTLSLIETEEE